MRDLTEIEKALPQTIELSYVAYDKPAAGYLGYYMREGKVWVWVAEDGKLTYAVDLI